MDLKEALFIENQLSPEPTRDQLIEALGVLAEHVREAMWMPIDTAPMYVRVLVRSKYGSPNIAACSALGWIVEGTVLTDVDGLFEITHWMPLPEPMNDPALMEESE